MKILFTNFHEYDGGGHDTYIYHLANALSQRHIVHVAAPATSQLIKKIASLPAVKTIPVLFKIRFNKLKKLCHDIGFLRRLLSTEQYDVVHVNGSADHTMVILARLFMRRKPRLVFTKHNSLPIKWGAMLRYRYATDKIIAVSHTVKNLFPVDLKTPMVVIQNGVDTEFFKPVEIEKVQLLRSQYHISSDTFVLGSIAGTALYKGWWLLLEAIKDMQQSLPCPIKVIIAGAMLSEDDKQKYIIEKGLQDQVILTGWLADVREIVPLFDMGFVLSYSIETISFACRQMMAMGKPVMVSDYNGLPENITPDVDGWVTRTKDVDSVKTCLTQIIANRGQLPEMSNKAREKAVAEFCEEKWISQTLNVYQTA
jgi:glycosyltransferase involved in cell wall biosynthesis